MITQSKQPPGILRVRQLPCPTNTAAFNTKQSVISALPPTWLLSSESASLPKSSFPDASLLSIMDSESERHFFSLPSSRSAGRRFLFLLSVLFCERRQEQDFVKQVLGQTCIHKEWCGIIWKGSMAELETLENTDHFSFRGYCHANCWSNLGYDT